MRIRHQDLYEGNKSGPKHFQYSTYLLKYIYKRFMCHPPINWKYVV